MGPDDGLASPKRALEPDFVPVSAGHAPRLEAVSSAGALYVFEPGRPDSYLMAENPIDLRR